MVVEKAWSVPLEQDAVIRDGGGTIWGFSAWCKDRPLGLALVVVLIGVRHAEVTFEKAHGSVEASLTTESTASASMPS